MIAQGDMCDLEGDRLLVRMCVRRSVWSYLAWLARRASLPVANVFLYVAFTVAKADGDSNHGCALARHDAGFLPRRSRSLREDECYGHQHSTASNASMCAAALVRRNRVH